jgi:Tfp pilus assembly protein PilO
MRFRHNFDKDGWITLGAIVAIALLFSWLSLVPALREKGELRHRQASVYDRLKEIQGSKKQLEDLRVQVAGLRDNVDRDDYFVPDQPALGDLIKSLDQSLQPPDVVDRQLNAGEFKRHRDYSTIPLALEMKMPFLSFAQTLRAIETQRRLTVVDEVRLRYVEVRSDEKPLGTDAKTTGQDKYQEPARAVEASLRLTTFFSEGKELPR